MFKTTEGNAYKSDGDFLLKYIERYDVVAVNTSKNVSMFMHIVVFKVTAIFLSKIFKFS